ncbi:unnamed protein product [Withania somnifera]
MNRERIIPIIVNKLFWKFCPPDHFGSAEFAAMDVNRKPKLRDDPASDARSFGSNYIQSSQSRKMSIGIVIDSIAKCRMQQVQQVGDQAHMAAVKTSSKEISVDNGTTMTQKTSSKGNFTNDRNKKEMSNTSAIRNQREPTEQQTSPWISTKTLHHEPTSEAVKPVEKPLIAQGVVEMCNISHRVEVGPAKSSLRSFLIQTRTLHFEKSKQLKEEASIERRGKFASKVVLEDMPEKEVKGKNTKTENAGNASLRLKLQEIVGTVSSPNNQCPNSQVLEQGVKASKPAQKYSGSNVGEPRQNSDTTESDTQSHEYAIRRPTTHSLARKRAPAKLKSQNIKRPAACKEDRLEKNVFLPGEKNVFLPKDLSSRTLRDAGTSPLMVYKRRGKRKSHHIEASTGCEQNNKRKDEKTSKNCKRVPVPEKFVYPGDGTTLFQEKNDEMVKPDACNLESPVAEVTEQLRDLREHIYQKENSVEKSKRKALDSEKDLSSRTLRDAGTSSPSMIYERRGKRKSHHIEASKVCEQNNKRKDEKTSKNCKRARVLEKFVYPGHGTTLFQEENDEMVQPDAGNLESPVVEMTEQLRNLQKHIDRKENSAEKPKRKALDSESDEQSPTFALKTPGRKSFPGFAPRSNLGQLHGDDHKKPEGICKVKSFDGLKREYKSNTPSESSDDAGNLEVTPFMESRHIIEEDTQKPSFMESDLEDSEDSSNIQAGMQQPLSPEICNTRKEQAPRPNKRLFNKGCGNLSGVSLAAASSKGIDCKKFERHFEQNEEDALTSATTLFSFSLERVRSKLKSVTNKKSAEILKSVAEKIQMQLQNAEFQIQADMGRITSLNKSKRKHVEEVLQEKQEHLNAIYEKFKEEVTWHLQDCKSTLESLEAHEVEVKATVEKRKASNKKLLLEVEESITTQLDNAERKVSSVYHAAREKLRQLKFVVAECLKEDVLG